MDLNVDGMVSYIGTLDADSVIQQITINRTRLLAIKRKFVERIEKLERSNLATVTKHEWKEGFRVYMRVTIDNIPQPVAYDLFLYMMMEDL